MVRAVIDTNVFVSAMMRRNDATPPGRVVDDFRSGTIVLLYDGRIVTEYAEVLHRPKFGFDRQSIAELLDLVSILGERIAATPFPGELPDPADRAFADVAFTGRADLLITGNVKDFPAGRALRIVTPRQWVDIAQRMQRFREAGDDERFALEELDQGTYAVAKACKKCGYVQVTDVFGFAPRLEPVLLPFPCVRPDPKEPDGRCGGEQWSYDDNDLGRRLAVASGIPVARR